MKHLTQVYAGPSSGTWKTNHGGSPYGKAGLPANGWDMENAAAHHAVMELELLIGMKERQ